MDFVGRKALGSSLHVFPSGFPGFLTYHGSDMVFAAKRIVVAEIVLQ